MSRASTLVLLAAASLSSVGLSIARAQSTFSPVPLADGYGESRGIAISADGSTVAGTTRTSEGELRVFRWTADTGMQDIGTLGGDSAWAQGSQAISDDGTVIVGGSTDAQENTFAFRWSLTDGMQNLGSLDESAPESSANAVSPSGNTVFGSASSEGAIRPFIWTDATGMTLGGSAGDTSDRSYAVAARNDSAYFVNKFFDDDDGSISELWYFDDDLSLQIPTEPGSLSEVTASMRGLMDAGIGYTSSDGGNGPMKAMMWGTIIGFAQELEGLSGYTHNMPVGTSNDGMIIVGRAFNDATDSQAAIWTFLQPAQSLQGFLTEYYGMTFSEWLSLTEANGVTQTALNRYAITGTGLRLDGTPQAFLVDNVNPVQTRWAAEPASNAWENSDNWGTTGKPYILSDAAFGPSTVTEIDLSDAFSDVGVMRFLPDAPDYRFNVKPGAILSIGVGNSDLISGVENLSAHTPLFHVESGGTMEVGGTAHFQNVDFEIAGESWWYDSATAESVSLSVLSGGTLSVVGESHVFRDTHIDLAGGSMQMHAPAVFDGVNVTAQGANASYFGTHQDVQWLDSTFAASDGGKFEMVDGSLGNSLVQLNAGGTFFLKGNADGGTANIQLSGETAGLYVQEAGSLGDATVTAGSQARIEIADGATADGATIHLLAGSTLDTSDFGDYALTIGALSGQGAVTFGTTNLRLGALGSDTSFSGTISGSGELLKVGGGTFTFFGVSDHTGNTTIEAGTLHLTGSLTASPQTFVNAGGTLSGTGSIGPLTIASGGMLSPGSSPGTLFAGDTIFSGGGNLWWEINDANGTAGADPGWDLLSITGQLGIAANSGDPFTIHLASLMNSTLSGAAANFDPLSPYAFDFVTASGGVDGFSSDAFAIDTSDFTNALTGIWSVALANDSLQLTYAPTAVPEPSTYAILAGTAALGLAAWRRRRASVASAA